MAGFLRLLLGVALLPMCWGAACAFASVLVSAAGAHGCLNAETLSFLGGMAVFALTWFSLSHPVKTYVFGHEMTHALWGLLFGARPSKLRVGAKGGSVSLTKTNLLITLAPYFFPFYTAVVILAGLVTYAFVRPLPWLPVWLFFVGLTWAFHVLFTLETLTQRQPDITLYGRIFSWAFIFLFNLVFVLVGLALLTPVTFADAGGSLAQCVISAYVGVFRGLAAAVTWIIGHVS